jgi:hypothetical protein
MYADHAINSRGVAPLGSAVFRAVAPLPTRQPCLDTSRAGQLAIVTKHA